MEEKQIKEILGEFKVIAVVGLSREPEKESHKVSLYLQKNGYRIIPVNPNVEEVLGEKSYQSLLDIPPEVQETIEIVDIFRPAKDVLQIVEQAIKLKQIYGKSLVIWMQLGIKNEQAAELAQNSGLTVVMDKCLMIEHRHLS